MYFSPFNAKTTNLFPASNTTNGGQLCTEFNLRSIDSVGTDPDVQFMLGSSFVHSLHEFDLKYDKTKGDAVFSILPGKAVVNGHYFESVAEVNINLAEGNSHEVTFGGFAVDGLLYVGLKMMYSTNTTLVGSLDEDGNYLGVQVVVLPKDQFHLPESGDVTDDESKVTAHIWLGSLVYNERRIVPNSITQNIDKTKYFDIRRVKNLGTALDGEYFSKGGLAPNRMYAVATKFDSDNNLVSAEFCDSTDSLMRWDSKNIRFGELSDARVADDLKLRCSMYNSATFLVSSDNMNVFLHVPHKQPDNNSLVSMKPTDYIPLALTLPVADAASGSPGIVNRLYSKYVNQIIDKINQFYRLPNGKQLRYIDKLDDRADLPSIYPSFNYGDYIIVREDNTLEDKDQLIGQVYSWPSTMYVIIPGYVRKIEWLGTDPKDLIGIELARKESDKDNWSKEPSVYMQYWDLESNVFRGELGDYFTYVYKYQIKDESTGELKDAEEICYYEVTGINPQKAWSDPILITGQIMLASEELIGGFLNVPDASEDANYSDQGYVRLDGNGHLRLVDYDILRSGQLAYQLGQPQEFTGMDLESLQTALDNAVNDRVAFLSQKASTEFSNFVDITVELQESEYGGVVEVRGIDSRFNTAVYVHILGDAGKNTTIRFVDCEKLMIDDNISGDFNIELYRCNLYYNADILNRLSVIKNMTLWYEKFDNNDPDIIVDGMTVREVGAAIPVEDVDYWSKDNPNDNHYQYALHSLTFDNDGWVVGLGLYVRDCTTRENLPTGKHLITASFSLPHGSRLLYPPTRFNRSIKVSGSFVSGYVPSRSESFKIFVADINFTVVTNVYDKNVSKDIISGKITLLDDSFIINSVGGEGHLLDGLDVDLPGINSKEFHTFLGGAIG